MLKLISMFTSEFDVLALGIRNVSRSLRRLAAVPCGPKRSGWSERGGLNAQNITTHSIRGDGWCS